MPNNKTASSSLGWALIGCGGAGNNHAQWAMSTPGVEIHGFCDKLIDSAERTTLPIQNVSSPTHQ